MLFALLALLLLVTKFRVFVNISHEGLFFTFFSWPVTVFTVCRLLDWPSRTLPTCILHLSPVVGAVPHLNLGSTQAWNLCRHVALPSPLLTMQQW